MKMESTLIINAISNIFFLYFKFIFRTPCVIIIIFQILISPPIKEGLILILGKYLYQVNRFVVFTASLHEDTSCKYTSYKLFNDS